MKQRTKLLSLAAAAALGMAAASQAAIITTSIKCNDPGTGLELPKVGGHYVLIPGQQFQVAVYANVTNPNLTDTFRSAANNGKPLGAQNITTNVVSPGSNGKLIPNADPGTPPNWNGYADATPDGFGFSFTNLIDTDGDGDLDAAGAGFTNNTLSLATGATAGALQKVQYGVDGSISGVQAAAAGPLLLFTGNYHAGATGGTGIALATAVQVGNVFFDPVSTAGDSATVKAALTSVAADQIVNGSVLVDVVPEPASMSLAGLGLFGLLAARRRNA